MTVAYSPRRPSPCAPPESLPTMVSMTARPWVSGQAETIFLLFGIEHATGTVWIDNVKLEKCQ